MTADTVALVSLLCLLLALHPLCLNVILALVTAGYGSSRSTDLMRRYALLYLATIGAMALVFFAGTLWLLASLSYEMLSVVSLIFAGLSITWGAMELAGVYMQKPVLSLPGDLERALHRRLTKRIHTSQIVRLGWTTAGACVLMLGPAFVSLACLIVLNSIPGVWPVFWFVALLLAPSFALAGFAVHGAKLSALRVWLSQSLYTLRGITGLTGIVIGWLCLLTIVRGGL